MASIEISEAEKVYVLHCVQEDIRVDGRGRKDMRPLHFETGVVSHANGSARLRLANTDVLVSVKADLETPDPERPNEGRLEFFVDCSANATPDFEGRGGESFAMELARTLAKAYADRSVFELEQCLCVVPGSQCWLLNVDVLVLECGGNVYDAVSMAVKAALTDTVVPKIILTAIDGDEPELQLSDDPADGVRLAVSRLPVLVTLCRIGNHCVVDPTLEEEACSTASLVMAVTPDDGKITAARKNGAGTFHAVTLTDAIAVGREVGVRLNKVIALKLAEERQLSRQLADPAARVGFMR